MLRETSVENAKFCRITGRRAGSVLGALQGQRIPQSIVPHLTLSVVQEFEQDVLNLYLEEEQRLHAHELRKREQEAALRWRQVRQQTILCGGSKRPEGWPAKFSRDE